MSLLQRNAYVKHYLSIILFITKNTFEHQGKQVIAKTTKRCKRLQTTHSARIS